MSQIAVETPMGDVELDKVDWIHSALERYEAPLIRYAVGITGDLERARDVVQDTFLRLCRQQPARLNNHLAQWLFTVCRNRALDVRRKERRLRPLDDAADPASEAGQSARLEHREALSQVMLVLETLPENQQEVVRLKFQNGLSYKEISAITELSVSNVGFLLHTALKTIRQRLQSESPPAALRRIK